MTVAVVLATTAWAQDFSLSAGGGGLLVGDFTGGVKSGGEKMTTPYFGGGGFAYFDATYAEVSVGFFVGGGDMKGGGSDKPWTLSALKLGLLGKYPIALSDALTLFPALGIEYDVVLSAKIDGTKVDDVDGMDMKSGDFSALWIKAGAGLDVQLTEKLYFRGEALFGIRLSNKFEKDMIDDKGADAVLGLGPTVKLGVGYKF
jgi:hypothetical protein